MNLAQGGIDAIEMRLPAMQILAEAKPLADALLGFRGGDPILDASAVAHSGAPCAQVLLSAFGTWRADGRSIAFGATSDRFTEGARLLDIVKTFSGEA